jgi:hypothetical protein
MSFLSSLNSWSFSLLSSSVRRLTGLGGSTVEDEVAQTLHFLVGVRRGGVVDLGDLAAEDILVVLNTGLQQVEVLVGVFLELADADCQFVGLLEYDCLHELLLLLESRLEVGVELVDFSVDLILEFVEVLLDGSESALDVLPVLFGVLEVVAQLLSELGEDALHLAVLFSHHFHHLLHLGVHVVAQLSCAFGCFGGGLAEGEAELLVGGGEGFLEAVDVVDDLVGDAAGELLEVELGGQAHLDLRLDHFGDLVDQFALVVLVEVVLLPQTLLHPPDLPAEAALLLLAVGGLRLQVGHEGAVLVLHGLVQSADAVLLPQQFVAHLRVHGVDLGLVLHLLTQLLLRIDFFPQVQVLLDLLVRTDALLVLHHQSVHRLLHAVLESALEVRLHVPQ